MFRLTHKTFNLLNKVIKNSVPVVKPDYRTVIKLNEATLRRVFYSTGTKSEGPKSPLASLFAKDAINKEPEPEQPAEEPDPKVNREQSWRRMKYTLMFFGISFTSVGIYLIFELGQPKKDEEGKFVDDQFTGMSSFKQYIMRTINELNYYRQLIKEPSREKLLPDLMKHPYYSPQYTLVLEFTDLVVHPEWTYNTGWRFKKRPGLDHFLESLSGIYEIVIYTAEQGMTVFPIVDAIDPKNHVNYKLVRDATLFVDGQHVKDLDKLNRDLKRTIVVDWNKSSAKFHPENVFQIPRWSGNDDDLTLLYLSSFLLAISQNQIDDVRDVVTYYSQFDDPLLVFREKQKELLQQAELPKEEPTTAAPVKKWSPSIFNKRL